MDEEHCQCSIRCTGAATNAWRLKYRGVSSCVTLVMWWNWHGCEICDLGGNCTYLCRCCFCCFRFLRPGMLSAIFSGSLVSRSMQCHTSLAAEFESKLKPITLRWSGRERENRLIVVVQSRPEFSPSSFCTLHYSPLDKHIVWKAGPATL